MRRPNDLKMPMTPFKNNPPHNVSQSPSPLQLPPGIVDVFGRQPPSAPCNEALIIQSYIPTPNIPHDVGFLHSPPTSLPTPCTSVTTPTLEVKSFFDFGDTPPSSPLRTCTRKFFESLRRRSRSNPDPQLGHKKSRSRSKSIPVEDIKKFFVEHLTGGSASPKTPKSNSTHLAACNSQGISAQIQRCTLRDFLAESETDPHHSTDDLINGNTNRNASVLSVIKGSPPSQNSSQKRSKKRSKTLFGSSKPATLGTTNQENIAPIPLNETTNPSRSRTPRLSGSFKDLRPLNTEYCVSSNVPTHNSNHGSRKAITLRSSMKDLRSNVRPLNHSHQRHKSNDIHSQSHLVVTKKSSQSALNVSSRRTPAGLTMTPMTNVAMNVTGEKGLKENQNCQHSQPTSPTSPGPAQLTRKCTTSGPSELRYLYPKPPLLSSLPLVTPSTQPHNLISTPIASRRSGGYYTFLDLHQAVTGSTAVEIDACDTSMTGDAAVWWKDTTIEDGGDHHGENSHSYSDEDESFSLQAYEDAAEFHPPSNGPSPAMPIFGSTSFSHFA